MHLQHLERDNKIILSISSTPGKGYSPPRSVNALCVVERAPQSSELLRRRQMEEEDDVYMAKVAEQVR